MFKVDKKIFGITSLDTASNTFLPKLDRFLAIGSFLSGLNLESCKDSLHVWI